MIYLLKPLRKLSSSSLQIILQFPDIVDYQELTLYKKKCTNQYYGKPFNEYVCIYIYI